VLHFTCAHGNQEVEVAKSLSQDNLSKVPSDELMSLLGTMEKAGHKLPTNILGHLVNVTLRAAECMQAALVQPHLCSRLVAVVEPWSTPTPSAFVLLDRSTWKVKHLELKDADKVKWFESLVLERLLVPSIEAGKDRSAWTCKFCCSVIEAFEGDNDSEPSELLLESMERVIRTLRCVTSIINMVIEVMSSADHDSLAFLQQLRESSVHGFEVTTSIALHDCEFYRSRLATMVLHRVAMVLHGGHMNDDLRTLAGLGLEFGDVAIDALSSMCRRLLTMRKELPEEPVQAFSDKLKGACVACLTAGMALDLSADKKRADALDKLVEEASLTYSLDGEMYELVASSQKARSKRSTMAKGTMFKERCTAIRATDPSQLETAECMTEMEVFMGREGGFKLSAELHEVVHELLLFWWQALSHSLSSEEALMPRTTKLQQTLAAGLSPFSPYIVHSSTWEACSQLLSAMIVWRALGDDDAARVAKDSASTEGTPRPALTELQSRIDEMSRAMQLVSNHCIEGATGCKQVAEQLTRAAIAHKLAATSIIMVSARAELQKAAAALKVVVEVQVNGTPWEETVPPTASLEKYMAIAKTTLMKHIAGPTALTSLETELQQVLA
jgi:hypothetical protein